jgi:hypothetical protein
MSELKAFNSDRIYWAVEQVERAAGDIDTLHLDDNLFYIKSEVDAAIAELKAQLRKTQRALWLDRAIRAEHMKNLIFEGELIYHDDSGEELDWRIMYRKWERAETACRAKAKEYE